MYQQLRKVLHPGIHPCPVCDGSGKVVDAYKDLIRACVACKGTGKVKIK